MKVTEGLTKLEEEELLALLGKVGGNWTEGFYNAVNRITALTAVYPVLLRSKGGDTEVFLTPRNDLIYKDKVHHPGSMVRWTDRAGFFPDAIERVLRKELAYIGNFTIKLADVTLTDTPRGMEVSLVLVCEGVEPQVSGQWYSVDKLPNNLIDHEVAINRIAVAHFKELARTRQQHIGYGYPP